MKIKFYEWRLNWSVCWMILLLIFPFRNMVMAQLPEADKLYLTRTSGPYPSSDSLTNQIYIYDPSLPASSTNPTLNTISLPDHSIGLVVSEVLGSGDPTLTFYTVVNGYFWYYDPNTHTWVNTGHQLGIGFESGGFGAGGGFIYYYKVGQIFQYDGTQDAVWLTSIADSTLDYVMANEDIAADCAGHLYLINIYANDLWFRKYDEYGNLMQQWPVSNPNNYESYYGFGMIGPNIYLGRYDYFDERSEILLGSFGGFNAHINTTTGYLPPYDPQTNGQGGDDIVHMIRHIATAPLSVPANPTVTISSGLKTCIGDSIKITAQTTEGGAHPHYQWFVNGQPVAGATESVFNVDQPQNGDVIFCQVTVPHICDLGNTVITSNSITLDLLPVVTPVFDSIGPYCFGVGIPPLPTTSNNGISGTWSPTPNNQITTTYTFTPDPNMCATSATMTVDIDTSIKEPTIINNEVRGCNSLTYQGKTYYDDTEVVVITPSVAGCDSVIEKTQIIIDHFDFDLKAIPNEIITGDQVNLVTSSSVPYMVTSWTPYDLFPNQNAFSQSIRLSANTTIVATAVNQSGCTTKDSVLVKVFGPHATAFLPNAFTPNEDGLNDRFSPIFDNPVAVSDMSFAIYNRYGQMVYKSFTVYDAGWNGYYRGRKAEPGSYFYILKFKLRDGTSHTKKGEVNLIR